MQPLIQDRAAIKLTAALKTEENDAFRVYLQQRDGAALDEIVHAINDVITPQIDCTSCGGCCQQLMINVTKEETISVAAHLHVQPETFVEKYVEESLQGRMIMNTIPCNFLHEKKCTIYEARFNECREFPHLHLDNFKGRLFATLIHYAMCPIIFNVIENLKVNTGFIQQETAVK